jgi:hypothetical protein
MNPIAQSSLAPNRGDPWHLAAVKTREAASAWWLAFTHPRPVKAKPSPAETGAQAEFPDHLDAATLKDIGAPDWLVSRAMDEQGLRGQHLLDLRQWRGG